LHSLVTNKQRDSEKEIIDRVEALAKKKGLSMAIIATAWILSKDGTFP
jgi:versiconal hemiacetal acetate reductase